MTSPTLVPYIEALERAIHARESNAREAKYGSLPPRLRNAVEVTAEIDAALLRALAEALKGAQVQRCTNLDGHTWDEWILSAPKEEA